LSLQGISYLLSHSKSNCKYSPNSPKPSMITLTASESTGFRHITLTIYIITFYRAALNAGRSSYDEAVWPSIRPSVCLSICLSNAWIVTKLKQNLSRFFRVAKLPIFSRYSLVAASSKKSSINTNTKWITRFPMSLR